MFFPLFKKRGVGTLLAGLIGSLSLLAPSVGFAQAISSAPAAAAPSSASGATNATVPLSTNAATAVIGGVIRASGAPAADARVTLTAGRLSLEVTTDAEGHFIFPAQPLGSYTVHATKGSLTGTISFDLTVAGADIELAIDPIKTIGRAQVTTSGPLANHSGGDVSLGADVLTKTAQSGDLGNLLIQNVPGAARGANGAVHINGDHGDINYVVDGVPLPSEINRAIGAEFDPSAIASASVLEGAYPAEVGDRFAGVVAIGTPQKAGPAGYAIDLKASSANLYDSTLSYHAPLANGGSIFLASRQESDGRALDPPNWVAVHDHGSNTTQVVRVTLPQGPADFLNFTATHSLQTYQIPNDVAGVSGVAYPASTDDTQTQDDLFASVQYRHAIGDHGTLSFGPSFKSSHLRDTPDYANDVLGANPQAPLVLPNSGTPATCANADLPALAAEGVPTGGLNDCALSIYADRTAIDIGWITQYELRSLHHDVKSGMTYDTTRVLKNYDVAFQPNNYFSPDRFDVYDHATNVGHTEAVYLQDSWRMSSLWTLDAGLREDAFQLRSAQFSVAEAMLSPRLKLTRTFSPRVSVYGYYGRFFTPYSFENVAPGAAACINPNVSATGGGPALTAVQCTGGSPNATGSGFDLKAQRDSDYEIGGSIGIGSTGRLGLRAMQKDATHSIDDVQVGLTNLHQDINYAVGRITVYAAAYQQSLSNHGRFSLNLSRTRAEAKDCETQLLAACVGQAPGFIPDDHDQTWDGTASLIRNDARGGWYSLDAEYGSGLSTAPSDNTVNTTYQAPVLNPYCPAPVGGVGNDNCKVPPHLTFDGEKGFQLQPGLTLAAGMTNLFNDRYWITYLNAQGFHTAQGRTVYVKLSLTK